jgi:hypothetical protein
MSSSWETQGPKSKVVDTHYHVAYFYGFVSAILALAILFGMDGRIPYENLVVLAVMIALTIAHLRVSDATERDATWAPSATTLLALPLLFGFPIGTYLGVKLLINASKLK